MSKLYPKPKNLTSFDPIPKWTEHECVTCKRHFWRRPGYKATFPKQYKHFYCSPECSKPLYKTGRVIDKSGYVLVKSKSNPNSRKHTHYIYEHRLIMEGIIGRYLEPYESVHHINGVKNDNRPENLELRVKSNHPKGISTLDMVKILRQLGYTIIPPS